MAVYILGDAMNKVGFVILPLTNRQEVFLAVRHIVSMEAANDIRADGQAVKAIVTDVRGRIWNTTMLPKDIAIVCLDSEPLNDPVTGEAR